MPLFNRGEYRLHSGRVSAWKIDCDALTDVDMATIAEMIVVILPKFGLVEGVPKGGLRLAYSLAPYSTDGPLLIVDDVLTTGGSMNQHRNNRDAIGAVIFNRGTCPEWVTPLFTMTNGVSKYKRID